MDVADAKIAGHGEDTRNVGASTSGRISNRQTGAGGGCHGEVGEIDRSRRGVGCDRNSLGKRPGGQL